MTEGKDDNRADLATRDTIADVLAEGLPSEDPLSPGGLWPALAPVAATAIALGLSLGVLFAGMLTDVPAGIDRLISVLIAVAAAIEAGVAAWFFLLQLPERLCGRERLLLRLTAQAADDKVQIMSLNISAPDPPRRLQRQRFADRGTLTAMLEMLRQAGVEPPESHEGASLEGQR